MLSWNISVVYSLMGAINIGTVGLNMFFSFYILQIWEKRSSFLPNTVIEKFRSFIKVEWDRHGGDIKFCLRLKQKSNVEGCIIILMWCRLYTCETDNVNRNPSGFISTTKFVVDMKYVEWVTNLPIGISRQPQWNIFRSIKNKDENSSSLWFKRH